MKCPQGCVHPAFGEDTMREETEREKLPEPEVIDVPGGTVVRETIEHRFMECRVCGWIVDV